MTLFMFFHSLCLLLFLTDYPPNCLLTQSGTLQVAVRQQVKKVNKTKEYKPKNNSGTTNRLGLQRRENLCKDK